MSKSERCRSECIDNSGINLGVVSGAVTIGQGQDIQLLHKVNTEDNGEPFVISYVLKQNNKTRLQWYKHHSTPLSLSVGISLSQ